MKNMLLSFFTLLICFTLFPSSLAAQNFIQSMSLDQTAVTATGRTYNMTIKAFNLSGSGTLVVKVDYYTVATLSISNGQTRVVEVHVLRPECGPENVQITCEITENSTGLKASDGCIVIIGGICSPDIPESP